MFRRLCRGPKIDAGCFAGQAYILDIQGDKINLTQRSAEDRNAEAKLEKAGVGQTQVAAGATALEAALARAGVFRKPKVMFWTILRSIGSLSDSVG